MANVILANCVLLIVLVMILFEPSAASPFTEHQKTEHDGWKNFIETLEVRVPQKGAPPDDLKRKRVTSNLEPFQKEAGPRMRLKHVRDTADARQSREDVERNTRNSPSDQLNVEKEPFDSPVIQELRGRKDETNEQEHEKDLKALKATVSELKTAMTEMSQQIDALLRQDSETLKLLNAKSASVGQRNLLQRKAASEQRVEVTTTGGVSYVRWGRTTCSNSRGTERLYKGYMGSSHYQHAGSGSNFLCLHEDPEWGVYRSGQQVSAQIWGTEYRLDPSSGSPFSTKNNQNENLNWNDAVCAVCHNPLRSNKIMIPARRSCPIGWTLEYRGYLVSSHTTHKRSSYVCLDEAPETIAGGEIRENGELLYPVEATCGALPCPKFVKGREIACVVCSK